MDNPDTQVTLDTRHRMKIIKTYNTEKYITQVTLDTRHRKIDTGNIGHKTQKDKHRKHWTQDIER